MGSLASVLSLNKMTLFACCAIFLFRGVVSEKFSFRSLLQHFNVSALPLTEEERVNFTHMAYGPTFYPHDINGDPIEQQQLLSNMNILFVSFPRQPGEIYFREVPEDLSILLDPSTFFRVSSSKDLGGTEEEIEFQEFNFTSFNQDLLSSSLSDNSTSTFNTTESKSAFQVNNITGLNLTRYPQLRSEISPLIDLLSGVNETNLGEISLNVLLNSSAMPSTLYETPSTAPSTMAPATSTTTATTSTTTSATTSTAPATTSTTTRTTSTSTIKTMPPAVEITTPRDLSVLLEVELLRFENPGSLRSDGRWCHFLWKCSPRIYADELDTTTPWAEWPGHGHVWNSLIAAHDYQDMFDIQRKFSQSMCLSSDTAALRVQVTDSGLTSDTLINEFVCWVPAKSVKEIVYGQWSEGAFCSARHLTDPRMRLTFRYRKLRQPYWTSEARCGSLG
ncbi:hypothetical protein RvY_08608 [Ramazzottius varieornatus]|uniref:Uncharacterized protein n=1 Tax=Ramazzottius varieornatus TaxID=947166 RepID=A0A1D1V6I2_RAMVA|nr:hypothetical protein RvY_08608 [Ramazzottius varieornatus]